MSRFVIGLLVCLLTATAAAQPDEAIDRLRAEFRAAYDEARRGIVADATDDSSALAAYALYHYLEAARLEVRVRGARGALGADDAAVERFLERHDVAPVTRTVRQLWLRSLAERGHWETFLSAYEPTLADQRLQCQNLVARIETGRLTGLASLVIDRWLTGRQLPAECEPAFVWLRQAGLLDDDLIERRVRLLLENGQSGFARVVARRLPERRAEPLNRWAAFVSNPAAAIDAWLESPDETREAVLLDGWARLARNAPGQALARADAVVAALERREIATGSFTLALALGLAWDRRSEALLWFERTEPALLDDYALGWLARAALWSGQWPLVEQAIAAMSRAERGTSTWRYWAARTLEARAGHRTARPAYEALLGDDNAYAAMAAHRLGQRIAPKSVRFDLDAELVAIAALHPAILRARELVAVGLRSEATVEWQHGYNELDEAARRQSIHVAASHGLYDIAVATATRHGIFTDYALLYPRPHVDEVSSAAAEHDLDPALIYAVMRQESLFREDAASAAGALGIMQLKRETAARTARAAGLPVPTRRDLFEPQVSIEIGAAHLAQLHAEFDGHVAIALAAYNAGPEAARRWLPSRRLDADIWIENIPYNETRAYVRRVLWHRVVFSWLEEARGADVTRWLAPLEDAGS